MCKQGIQTHTHTQMKWTSKQNWIPLLKPNADPDQRNSSFVYISNSGSSSNMTDTNNQRDDHFVDSKCSVCVLMLFLEQFSLCILFWGILQKKFLPNLLFIQCNECQIILFCSTTERVILSLRMLFQSQKHSFWDSKWLKIRFFNNYQCFPIKKCKYLLVSPLFLLFCSFQHSLILLFVKPYNKVD